MRKISLYVLAGFTLVACDKHDPILPGTRTAIFGGQELNILNTPVSGLSENAIVIKNTECPYTQDNTNTIRKDDKKIFIGFPAPNSVQSSQKPVCAGGYVYAGLTTGELIKLSKNGNLIWMADIFKQSNMMGGCSVVDIVAPIVVLDNWIYVGGMGDAFCKVSASSGNKKWCTEIGTTNEFIITNRAIYVVGIDNNLYALRNTDGAIYWKTEIKKQTKPIYENKIITIGREKINAETGEMIK
ncbi:MAG: PQQ-binding-like beta-propeller repeat protein [Alphaproteobacteria bacterium]